MSLGDKMKVPITVLTLFGRFDKRWRLQIVSLFSLCINLDIIHAQTVLSPIYNFLFKDFDGWKGNFLWHFGKLY
jgi:hypothetical protein